MAWPIESRYVLKEYIKLISDVLDNGAKKEDRTGTGTISLFGHQSRYDLAEGFPLVTTKKCHLKSIIHELLWFINGDTNVKYLQDNNVRIWNEWADESGELGPVYGAQWRRWKNHEGKEIDQLSDLVHELKKNPNSRRLILNAWNVGQLSEMALPPCHAFVQFYVHAGKLSCQLYQRSADVFLGVPFNIASYSLFTMMLAQVCSLELGEFVHTLGDAHIYLNHLDQVNLQLGRTPYRRPKMELNPRVKDIFSFKYDDFSLKNYEAHPHIKGVVAI